MELGIIGYGEHGRHIEALAREVYGEVSVVVFDDPAAQSGLPNAHRFADWRQDRFAELRFLVALGYRHLELRVRIIDELLARGRQVPPLVHPSASVSRHARLGEGAIAATMAAVAPGSVVERGAFLSTGAVVSHDVTIGPGCHLGPGAVLAGASTIGACTFIGAGAAVANGRRVGRGCRIGMATAVTRDVPDGQSAIGSPMRILAQPLAL